MENDSSDKNKFQCNNKEEKICNDEEKNTLNVKEMVNKENLYLFQFVVGDWSKDGHGMTSVFNIQCNLNFGDFGKAYENGIHLIGFDIEKYCKDYEDGGIPIDFAMKLKEQGFDVNKFDDDLEKNEDISFVYIDSSTYFEIYMFIAFKGNPKLIWNYAEIPIIKIGGYGLFS